MALHRIAIVSCAALITLMLAAALLLRAGDGPFHVVETAVTPTVDVDGLAPPSTPAARPERVDLDRLATTTLVLLLLSSLTAAVTLLGVIGSENLALKGRRVIEVMLGASPRWLVGAAARLWCRRLVVAGVGGGLLCAAAVWWLVRAAPPRTSLVPPAAWPPLAVLALVAVLVFATGVAPVRGLYRPGRSLSREAGSRQHTDPRPQQFNRMILITLQLAIAVAILTSSGLLILSSQVPSAVPAPALAVNGDRGQTVVGRLASQDASADPMARAAIYESALAALQAWPGLAAESLATPGAWIGRGPEAHAVNECGPCSAGGMPHPIHRTRVQVHAVMPGFFAERGMRFLAGNGFAEVPPETGAGRSVVINQAYARAHFIGPLGKTLTLRGGDDEVWYEVAGVVTDAPRGGLGDSGSRYAVYYSALEHPPSEIELVATVDVPQSAGLDDSLRVVREALATTPEGDLVISDFRSARDEMARVYGTAGWLGSGARAAGMLAGLVALAGVTSTLRAHIRARLREMGIRAAVGAPPGTLRRMVIREALRLGAVGSGLGLWAATFVIALLSPRAVDIFSAPLFMAVAVLFIGSALLVALPSARLAASAQPRTVMEA